MNTRKQQNLAKKTTALLGAIAASSFLGLPALAQMNPNRNTTQGYPYSDTDRGYGDSAPQSQPYSGSNQYSAECVPIVGQSGSGQSAMNQSSMNQSSMNQSGMNQSGMNQTSGPASTLGPAADASQPGVRSFPNQTDPRAGATLPTTNQGTSSISQTNTTTSQTNVGGPVESQSNAQTIDYSSSSQSNSGYSYNSRYNRFGDVLSFGGSTNGGHAREIVEAAGDRDQNAPFSYMSSYSVMGNRDSNRAQAGSGNYISSNMSSNRMMSSANMSDRCGPGMMLRQSDNSSGQFQNRQNQFQDRSTSETRDYQQQNTPAQPGDRQGATDSDRGGNAR